MVAYYPVKQIHKVTLLKKRAGQERKEKKLNKNRVFNLFCGRLTLFLPFCDELEALIVRWVIWHPILENIVFLS